MVLFLALWRQEAHSNDPTPVRNLLLSPSLFLFAYLTFLSFLIVDMRLDKNPAYPPLSVARRVKALASLTVREISHVASALSEANIRCSLFHETQVVYFYRTSVYVTNKM